MSDSGDPEALRTRIAVRLTQGDVPGAWAAVQDLAAAVPSAEGGVRLARIRLLACLEALEANLRAAGITTIGKLPQTSNRLAACTSLEELGHEFVVLAYRTLRPALLDDLLRRRRPELLAVARRRTRDSEVARDVVATVFLELLADTGAPDPTENLEDGLPGLVDAAAHNHVRRRFRRARRSRPLDGVAKFLGYEGKQEVAVTARQIDELARKVLPSRLYDVYRLKRRGRKPREIAEALGIARRTVRDWWQRAREILRRQLGLEGTSGSDS